MTTRESSSTAAALGGAETSLSLTALSNHETMSCDYFSPSQVQHPGESENGGRHEVIHDHFEFNGRKDGKVHLSMLISKPLDMCHLEQC